MSCPQRSRQAYRMYISATQGCSRTDDPQIYLYTAATEREDFGLTAYGFYWKSPETLAAQPSPQQPFDIVLYVALEHLESMLFVLGFVIQKIGYVPEAICFARIE